MGNAPALYVSEDCKNVIWALETWKDLDGEASATKDPIDDLRYLFTSACGDEGEGAAVRDARRRGGIGDAYGMARAAAPDRAAGAEARRASPAAPRRARARVC